jgi:5-methylcytosine-specific restriction endonuclease McrA
MSTYSLTHLSDAALQRDLDSLVCRDRGTTAELVAHIAEMDRRGSYAPAHASMHAYCIDRLHLSEDAAYKRIQAARAALEFPILFVALAEGRLNLSSVCLLAAHLSKENVGELVTAATHKSNADLRQWLADRLSGSRQAPVPVASARQLEARLPRLAARQVAMAEPACIPETPEPADVAAGPCAYDMQFTMTPEDHERFRYAQVLLSHAVPSGDVAEIYRRAIALLIRETERRRFASTSRPQAKQGPVRGRHVSAGARRAVWTRDRGRCTFVTPSGHRCRSRSFLEFDHVVPVARGGVADEQNLRLRCRTHNQHAAKRVFGSKFMREKRRQAYARARTAVGEGPSRTSDGRTAQDYSRSSSRHPPGTSRPTRRSSLSVVAPTSSAIVSGFP